MALSSQSQRVSGVYGGSHRQRRRQRIRRLVGALVMILLVVLLAWWWAGGDGDATTDQPGDTVGRTGPTQADLDHTADQEPVDIHIGEASGVIPPPNRAQNTAPPPNNIAPSTDGRAGNDASSPDTTAPGTTVADSTTNARPAQAQPRAPVSSDAEVRKLIETGRQMVQQGQLTRGRELLNSALSSGRISPVDATAVRGEMAALNEKLIFSPEVYEDDPLTEAYIVKPGDYLSTLARPYKVPWKFIVRINNGIDPRRLRVGLRVKVVKGPFHAVVNKNAYRMDVYLGDMYVRSFDVGLGKHSSTPVGAFVVVSGKKLINPEWVNPRTGQRYLADDPNNPIGERWIGLRGIDANTETLTGYGIHGTIEPDSIGAEASMGCIRMRPENVELVYDMLLGGQSKIVIVN